jgi:hypothetical protein
MAQQQQQSFGVPIAAVAATDAGDTHLTGCVQHVPSTQGQGMQTA